MTRRPLGLILLGMLVMPVLSSADGERETSVYDKHPECAERSEGGAPPEQCIPQDGAPNRKGLATRNAETQRDVQSNAEPTPAPPGDAESATIGR